MKASPPFVAPHQGIAGRWLSLVANAGWLRNAYRATVGRLPFPVLRSDVRDVIYATWLVPHERISSLIPAGVVLDQRDGMTLFTVLTYRHGNFGPALAGPFRRLFPSPLQSNWRLYVREVEGVRVDRPTVMFIRNVFDSSLYAIGSRIASDALPSHLASRFVHNREGEKYETMIDGGAGSAPSTILVTSTNSGEDMPASFNVWSDDRRDMLAMLSLQDRALALTPDGRLAEATIDLPIDIDAIEPLHVDRFEPGSFLKEIGADHSPWCFLVHAVPFSVLGERLVDDGRDGDPC